jgi:hypothetical protein
MGRWKAWLQEIADRNNSAFIDGGKRCKKGYSGLHDLYRIPVLGGPDQILVHDLDSPVSFSPGGKRIAFMRGIAAQGKVEIHVANVDGSGDHAVASLPTLLIRIFLNGVAWSLDGKTILVPTYQYPENKKFLLTAINLNGGATKEFLASPEFIGVPAWMPDGRSVVTPMQRNGVQEMQTSMPRNCGT